MDSLQGLQSRSSVVQPQQERCLQKMQKKEDWIELRACDGIPNEVFFEARYIEQAIDICDECQVRTECRDYAIKHGIVDGVWGGLSPNRLKTMAGML